MSGAGAVISGGVGAGVGKLKVDLGSLQGQANSMANVSHGRTAAFQGTIGAYANFAGAANLQGAAYDAAKAFGQNVIVPYYQACIIFTEAVADGCNKLVSLYTSMVGEESLDQEELEAQIAAFDKTIKSLKNSLDAAKEDQSGVVSSSDINNLNLSLGFTQSQRQKVQEKLDKLIAFGGASAGVFETANSLGDTASQGEGAIHSSLNAGNFNMPADMGWVATTQANWAAREQAIIDNYHAAVAKVQNGEELNPEDITAIDRYRTAYPGEPIDPSVLAAIDSYWITSNYRAAVSKVKRGKELTEQDVEAIERYQQQYPDKVDQTVLAAVEAHRVDSNYQEAIDKAKKGKDLTAEDVNAITAYGKKNPNVSLSKETTDALKKFFNNVKEGFDAVSDEFDFYANLVEQLGVGIQRLGGLVASIGSTPGPLTVTPKGSVAPAFVMLDDAARGAGQAIANNGSKIAQWGKGAGYALMGLGFGLGMYDDLANNNKTVGQAIANNTASAGIGFLGATAGSTLAATAFAATPIGWAAIGTAALTFAGGYLLSQGYNWVYNNNFLGAQDFVDTVGSGLDWAGEKIAEGVGKVGQAISDAADFVNPLNWGW